MKILCIRHGRAGEREPFAASGQPDSARPLTAEGKRRLRRGCDGLLQLLPRLDLIASSPLLRAVQSAKIVHSAYPKADRILLPELSPGESCADLLRALTQDGHDHVAAVGHEPDLGRFICWLLCGKRGDFHPLKKGAACLLEIDPGEGAGHARLLWSMTASHLDRIGQN